MGRPRRWGVLLASAAAGIPLAFASAAQAAPGGIWAPFDRCPLEQMQDPSLTTAMCVSATTHGGSMQIGRTPIVSTDGAPVNVQFGVTSNDGTNLNTVSRNDAIKATPVRVPGGLVGITGEANLKRLLGPTMLGLDVVNRVTATVEQAGPIENFDLLGALMGTPVFEMPVKLHLENPVLGSNCYIGSNQDPIVLRPQTGLTDPAPPNEPIEGGLGSIEFHNDPAAPPQAGAGVLAQLDATMVDNTFAVPKARNCGPLGLGLLDGVINQRQTLPQQPGANTIILEDNDSYLGGSGNVDDQGAGQVLGGLIAGSEGQPPLLP